MPLSDWNKLTGDLKSFNYRFCLNLFYSPITNDNDELVAIQLEITEINKQINRLRRRRSHLNKQQQKLKEIIKQNQQSTTTITKKFK